MAEFLVEIDGINEVVNIINSILCNEDKDTPIAKRSKELLDQCNEIMENYIGIENEFSCHNLKEIYHELLLDMLDKIIDKRLFLSFSKLQIKYVQFCELNNNSLLLHAGD